MVMWLCRAASDQGQAVCPGTPEDPQQHSSAHLPLDNSPAESQVLSQLSLRGLYVTLVSLLQDLQARRCVRK